MLPLLCALSSYHSVKSGYAILRLAVLVTLLLCAPSSHPHFPLTLCHSSGTSVYAIRRLVGAVLARRLLLGALNSPQRTPPQFISLPPLGPGFTPAFPINFVSVFWGNGVGDFTTGSCNASSPLCPELATGFPINVVSLIWDGGVSDLTTGWDGSCNFTCPLCPEPPPVSPPDFISLLWDEGIRDTTTGWDRSCGVTPWCKESLSASPSGFI